jgi:hypothetical protein
MLSAAFALWSLVLLMRGGVFASALAAILFACSVLSKETSLAMIPLAIGAFLITGRPIRRLAWLALPVAIALGARVAVLGSLGGYGTARPAARLPSLDLLPAYRDTLVRFLADFAAPGPSVGTYVELSIRLSVLTLVVVAAAWLCPRRERSVALLGLAWFLVYAEFYALLRAHNGGWYLYQPVIGIGLLVGGLAAGAAARWPSRRALPALALAVSGALVALHSSPLITPYPEWIDVSRLSTTYLAAVDTCTEDGNPPLVPNQKGPYSDVVSATGLADYSVRAYLELKYPDGRPCDQQTARLGAALR